MLIFAHDYKPIKHSTMKKYLLILLSAIAFVACSDDENETSIPHMVSPIPKSELTAEVKDFFGADMGKSYVEAMQYLPFNLTEFKFSTSIPVYAYEIINSQEELESIYTGQRKLPEIDFTSYSLILGCFIGYDTSWRLQRVVLQDNAYEMLLTGYLKADKKPDAYYQQPITYIPFWNFYPKLADKPLKVWANWESPLP